MKLDGSRLVTARHRKGLNQFEVASAVGVSIVTVSNAENNRDVYPGTGRKICEFLGIDLAAVVLPAMKGSGDAA